MLTISDLKPADILLSTGEAKASKVIRGGTMSRYSHAALYIGKSQIIEAIGSGVTLQSLEDAMSDDTLVSVYRRLRMSDEQGLQVIRYAKEQIGKKYDYVGAFGGGVTSGPGFLIGIFLSPIVIGAGVAADLYNRMNPEAAFYCSELVAIAFEKAAVPLGSGAASTTPADISRSHVLNYIGDLKKT
ncbi:conserved hypothetical protein [Candidatus Competibacter denitrificans Run_A_D11]|uniref:Uncharacterized protein n=1 Tax=Candidatus Competibacter denitrificans Run_A_D11 TaxID=1400863 RepID=W6M9U0_9GAMM|nr:YiiX/YebB-like N1pC/P60 family cysteine hydrolase [Candidatus Competibacter denitrificans]CDI02550.1 conserved hypothetical protein [Candidatus Competibacter denitrificans Run_A_D11]HRC69538.1 YiiX/YebB-like N1pC/P60 family cysteine hydrolase [Candidatus Competibacter denitrificans]